MKGQSNDLLVFFGQDKTFKEVVEMQTQALEQNFLVVRFALRVREI